MTEGERMVWAAVYASRWAQALEKREVGTDKTDKSPLSSVLAVPGVPMSVPTCIEEAWVAVSELRGARRVVQQGWLGSRSVSCAELLKRYSKRLEGSEYDD